MNQTSFICSTCGMEYAPSAEPPRSCPVCEDERQYVNPGGQSWTTPERLSKTHKNIFDKIAKNIYAVYTSPGFAIGQRAHLLITPNGNILWDCIVLLDATTIDIINRLGGIQKIAISHPHYYTTMATWSNTFKAPVYLHKRDAQWIARKDFDLRLWEGATTELLPGVTLINCAGHFEGGAVLHYGQLLLTGDIIQVAPDRKTVGFMYSYPNYIPLNKKSILHIKDSLNGFRFDAMYGAFGRYIEQKARQSFDYSIDRYLKIFE
ncbi:MBL fold metallo-hydrolase [Niabella ginsenosidivorans]|uniref:MBL fold metallo-hydrolase n=1 Tax=Niabella ginsenosidivorans TaxID=1176587 RepID=A0A1A9HWU3_9BACT|nr:MBL fold metallo-hydrolase [Niabella ginsenosidivorans]ANH79856.1 MBL fold metallo-hydrolase [Niabella ginsenosidivorans]